MRAAKEIQFNSNQSEEKAFADTFTSSFEQMQQVRDGISVHQQNIDRYQKTLEQTDSKSFSTNDDLYHRELEFISKQKDQYGFNYGMNNAQKLIEQGGGEYGSLHQAFMSKYVGTKQKMVNYDAAYEQRAKEIDRPLDDYGSKLLDAKNNLKGVNQDAKSKAEGEFSKSAVIDTQKLENIEQGNEYQRIVNKYEDKRIAPSKFGKDRNTKEKLDDY